MKEESTQPKAYTIPTIDLAYETHRQVIVDREPGQYLGHPTTVMLEDNKTMLVVYPKGHGRGAIVNGIRNSEFGIRNYPTCLRKNCLNCKLPKLPKFTGNSSAPVCLRHRQAHECGRFKLPKFKIA